MNRDFSDSYKTVAAGKTAPPREAPVLPEAEAAVGNFAGAKSAYARVGFAVTILLLVRLIAELAIGAVVKLIENAMYEAGALTVEAAFSNSSWYVWLMSFLPFYGIALPLAYLVIRKVPVIPREKRKMGVGSWLILAICAVGVMFGGNLLGTALQHLFDSIFRIESESSLDGIVGRSSLLQVLLFTCVLAPIGEEFIFRKLIISRTRAYGDRTAIVVSALLFGLFHGNMTQAVYAAALGILLGYIYTKSGKYHLCVLLHAFVNFMMGFVPTLAQRLESTVMILLLAVFEFVSLVAAAVMICVLAKGAVYRQPELPLARGKSGRAAFGNPGMITAVVTMSVMIMVTAFMPLITG